MGVPPSVDQVIQPVDTMGFFIAKMINYPYEKYALRSTNINISTADKKR